MLEAAVKRELEAEKTVTPLTDLGTTGSKDSAVHRPTKRRKVVQLFGDAAP